MKPFNIVLAFFTLISISFLSSCTDNTVSKEKNTSTTPTEKKEAEKKKREKYLPEAAGAVGEVLVLMDSSKWNRQVGKTFKSIFAKRIETYLRPEPIFKLNRVDPGAVPRFLERFRTIISVITLDGSPSSEKRLKKLFSKETIAQIKSNPERAFLKKESLFAKNQLLFFVFGKNDKQIKDNLKKYGPSIVSEIEAHERKKLLKMMLAQPPQKQLMNKVKEDHGLKITLPKGYMLARNQTEKDRGFLFLRRIGQYDENIAISYEPYRDESQLTLPYLMNTKDSLGKAFMYDKDRPESYIVTENLILPSIKPVSEFPGFSFAMRMDGWWRTSVKSMGGPFLAYSLIDKERQRIYFVEGFVYAPGKDKKRELMREQETIIYTLREL